MTTAISGPGVNDLLAEALAGTAAHEQIATSVFGVHHGTRLAGAARTFETRYLLVRSGTAFGACAVDRLPLDEDGRAALCGATLADLMRHDEPAVRVAALDAHLALTRPWGEDPDDGSVVTLPLALPAGTPEERAAARDAAVAEILGGEPGRRIGLVGVVNPLVDAIRERGCEPLPCDLWLDETADGTPVVRDHAQVVERADAVLATGMTLGNGTYDDLAARCAERGVPLALYAQTGSAIARALVGRGLVAASCEPFPFSQFSAEETRLHLVREAGR